MSNYTCVFWDVAGWCPCDDTAPQIIYGRIKSALYHEGFTSPSMISAYVDPNKFPDELLRKYRKSEFMVIPKEHKSARFYSMVLDIALWALNTRERSTFVVITKISEHTEYFIHSLLCLKQRGCDVCLVMPDALVPNDATNISVSHRGRNNDVFLTLHDHAEMRVCICPNLFEKKPYFEVYAEDYEKDYKNPEEVRYEDVYWEDYLYPEEDDEYTQDIEEAYVEDEEDESFSHDIPKAISFSMDSESGDGKTGVFWDVMDYPLPVDLDSCLFYEKIKSFLVGEGYLGELFIWAYVPYDLLHGYQNMDKRFTLVPNVPGDKYARLNKMTLDLVLWAIDNHAQRPLGPNLMVIAKNVELKTRFYQILHGFKSARRYTVCLPLPDDDDDNVAQGEAPYTLDRIVTLGLPWKSLFSR